MLVIINGKGMKIFCKYDLKTNKTWNTLRAKYLHS